MTEKCFHCTDRSECGICNKKLNKCMSCGKVLLPGELKCTQCGVYPMPHVEVVYFCHECDSHDVNVYPFFIGDILMGQVVYCRKCDYESLCGVYGSYDRQTARGLTRDGDLIDTNVTVDDVWDVYRYMPKLKRQKE